MSVEAHQVRPIQAIDKSGLVGVLSTPLQSQLSSGDNSRSVGGADKKNPESNLKSPECGRHLSAFIPRTSFTQFILSSLLRSPEGTASSCLGREPQVISNHPFGVLDLTPKNTKKIFTTK